MLLARVCPPCSIDGFLLLLALDALWNMNEGLGDFFFCLSGSYEASACGTSSISFSASSLRMVSIELFLAIYLFDGTF